MMNFSIIAIKILAGNSPNITKVLQEGWYFFNQSYKIEDDELIKNENYQLSENFFGENISISAIVGKNGSGKSSLLDLLLGMMYNLSVNMGLLSSLDGKDNPPVIKLNAELYFELDGNLCYIKCLGKNNIQYNIDEGLKTLPLRKELDTVTRNTILSKLFYSIVVNYSMQAYISNDYKYGRTRFAWIDYIFHKNDGYQTPIVINPYRSPYSYTGTINLNTEFNLTKQRLAALLIQSKKINKQFIDGYELNSVRYTYNPRYLNEKIATISNITVDTIRNSFANICKPKADTYISVVLSYYEFSDIPDNLSNQQKDAYIYLVHKTLNIAHSYPSYSQYKKPIEILNAKVDSNKKRENLKQLVNKILNNDKSHITLKIRQTLNFLNKCDIKKLSEFKKKNIDFNHDEYINVLNQEINFQDLSEIMEHLPPPFFNSEFFLNKTISDINNPIPFNLMSSGEKQFLYSMSSVLYHVKKLMSVHDSKDKDNSERIKYKNFNIILDEIELCFHPEYQRQFVNKLIGYLERITETEKDKYHFNVILATHSPFILSDIPNCNIMYLEDGKQKSDMPETFGANIHDILRHSFFLENGSMGNFAQKRINSLLSYLCDDNNDNWNKTSAKQFIDLVGEPIIKQELSSLYYANFEGTDEKIARLKKELEELESKK